MEREFLDITIEDVTPVMGVDVSMVSPQLSVAVEDITPRLIVECEQVYEVEEGGVLYTPLEYIESTGTQWIDTGLKGSPKSTVDVTFSFDSMEQSTANNAAIFGGRVQQTSNTFTLFKLGSTNLQYFRFDYNGQQKVSTSAQITWAAGHKYRFAYDGSIATLENLTTSEVIIRNIAPSERADTSPIALFAVNTNGTTGTFMKGKIYSYAYSDGETSIDLIPVLDKDNVACMYDKVSGEYFYNQGTNNFLYELK